MKRSRLIHLFKSRCRVRATLGRRSEVSLLGTRDALGVGAGMAIRLLHMDSKAHIRRTCTHTRSLTPLPGNERHGQRIETEPFPGMIALVTQKP